MRQILVFFSIFSAVNCILIGKIENYLNIGNVSQILLNRTINECICQMLQSNNSILSLNYYLNNQSCHLSHSNINTITIDFYPNSSLIFTNQSAVAIVLSKYQLIVGRLVSVFECFASIGYDTGTTSSSSSTTTTTAVPGQ